MPRDIIYTNIYISFVSITKLECIKKNKTMNVLKYIQQEFGTLINKKHNKTLEQIMSDFWQEASKGMFTPQTLGGHGKRAIRVFLEDDAEHVFYYIGDIKRLELFTSKSRKLTEYVKKYATPKNKSRIESFLKKYKKHRIILEFRFWADEDTHKFICEDCDKEISVSYSEEDEEWMKSEPQYDIAAIPNDLREILHDLARKGINIDYFKDKIDKLLLRANNLLKEEN